MSFALMLDNYMADGIETLAPYFSAFTLKRPFKISSDVKFPKPVQATFGNYLYHKEPVDPVKRKQMEMLFANGAVSKENL